MNTNRSVSFDDEAMDLVRAQMRANRTDSFSFMVCKMIKERAGMDSIIIKQKALLELRASSMRLFDECDVPQEAILSWVRDVTGGEKESPPGNPPKKKV